MSEAKTATRFSNPALGNSIPRWIFLQLLESCNLRCRMCYEWGESGSYNEKAILSKLDMNVIKQIVESCSSVKPYYELYGGEPLLYPQLEEVLELITHYGSTLHMPTNGTLLERKAEMLVKYNIDRFWVSLDGPEEINDEQRGKGVFAKAKRGIEKLYEAREARGGSDMKIGVSLVVTPSNHKHIARTFFESLDLSKLNCISIELQAYITEDNHNQYVKLLKEKFDVAGAPIARGFVQDIRKFADMDYEELSRQLQAVKEECARRGIFVNMYPKSTTAEDIRKYFTANWFEMSKVKNRCVFPWISTEVSARGEVTSCHAYYDLTLGNVNETSLLDIWNGQRYSEYRKHLKKELLPICQGCCLFYNEKPL